MNTSFGSFGSSAEGLEGQGEATTQAADPGPEPTLLAEYKAMSLAYLAERMRRQEERMQRLELENAQLKKEMKFLEEHSVKEHRALAEKYRALERHVQNYINK